MMRRLSSPARSLLSSTASTRPPRRRQAASARRVFPLTAAPNQPARRAGCWDRPFTPTPHGYWDMARGIGVKGEEMDKPDRRLLVPSANDNRVRSWVSPDISDTELDSDGEEGWSAQIPRSPVDGVFPLYRFPRSRHRDGSICIYRRKDGWKEEFGTANRDETRMEAMMLSDPTDCVLRVDGTCMRHRPRPMLQIFTLKLHKVHVDGGLVELYGYIAARDRLDRLLNHVISFSRDDPIIVEQGSLINMAGPKRGIELIGTILIEYDLRIKTGKHEKDDLQLIDGASIIDDISTEDRHIFTRRIHGEYGSIEISASRLLYAVEATIEVVISEMYRSFNLHLGCFTSGLQKQIQLFDGDIGESCGLKRSVVAVVMHTSMELKFRVGSESSRSAEHCCSFEANQHGCVSKEIKTDLALISVKVTWSPLPCGRGVLFRA